MNVTVSVRSAGTAAQCTLTNALVKSLPFPLTRAQRNACAAIGKDLAQPYPMRRLLQGDVGSGKTLVAAVAALQAIENGWQAALMAPTEILAEQHYLKLSHWLEPLGVKIASRNTMPEMTKMAPINCRIGQKLNTMNCWRSLYWIAK